MRPLVDGAEELWSVSPPHEPDATGKLSTTVEHGLLRLSLDTGVARDPVMPENLALQSYLMRLSLGQQALALGDVSVQETGLWKPLTSRGMHGSMNLRGLKGGLFLLKDPASGSWDDPLTGAMIEQWLFSRNIRLRAMAALGDETRVSGVGLSAPLLGETLSLSGDLFRSDSDEAIGDAVRVQGSGKHAGLAYSLGFARFGPSYSNPFRPEQLGGHEQTSLNLSKLLPLPGDQKLSAAYGLRLREGPYSTLLIHDGRLGLTLGKEGWLIAPSYTLSLTEPLLRDSGSVGQHGVSISAWFAPWQGVTLNPSLSYTQRTASSDPVLFETWHAGLKTVLPIHPGSELHLALEGQEYRSDGSF
jgi:hypothetical protein